MRGDDVKHNMRSVAVMFAVTMLTQCCGPMAMHRPVHYPAAATEAAVSAPEPFPMDQSLVDLFAEFENHQYNDTARAYVVASAILEKSPTNRWHKELRGWIADYQSAVAQYPQDFYQRGIAVHEHVNKHDPATQKFAVKTWMEDVGQLKAVLITDVLSDVENRLALDCLDLRLSLQWIVLSQKAASMPTFSLCRCNPWRRPLTRPFATASRGSSIDHLCSAAMTSSFLMVFTTG
jgi:hypothetical protein